VAAAILVLAGAILAALAITDIRSHRLPDGLNLAFALLGISFHATDAFGRSQSLAVLAAGAIAGAALLGLVRWSYRWRTGREGLGLGDVKYVAAAGFWVGVEHIALVILAGAVLTLCWVGGRLMISQAGDRWSARDPVPFGPGLIVSTVIVFAGRFFFQG
jgi:leader peptidase (prepilin peptidase)/N-methyltransferase